MDKSLDTVQAGFGQGFGQGLGQSFEQGSGKDLDIFVSGFLWGFNGCMNYYRCVVHVDSSMFYVNIINKQSLQSIYSKLKGPILLSLGDMNKKTNTKICESRLVKFMELFYLSLISYIQIYLK